MLLKNIENIIIVLNCKKKPYIRNCIKRKEKKKPTMIRHARSDKLDKDGSDLCIIYIMHVIQHDP